MYCKIFILIYRKKVALMKLCPCVAPLYLRRLSTNNPESRSANLKEHANGSANEALVVLIKLFELKFLGWKSVEGLFSCSLSSPTNDEI